jgi:hypothetical protein
VGIYGVESSEVVYHTIEAIGVVWEQSGNDYIISDDEDVYNSNDYSVGNFASGDSSTRATFNWVWKSQIGRCAPWGLGLYKITNSKVPDKYFYFDTRDNDYDNGGIFQDIWLLFNVNEERYYCIDPCDEESIENGELVRVSDVLDFTPSTDELEDYWSNVLVILTDGDNPRLVWGTHPTFDADYYKVYRAVSSTPLAHPAIYASVIATVSSSTYEYTDGDISLSTNGNYVYYFVKGYKYVKGQGDFYSGPTNIELVRGYMYKENITDENNTRLKFSLNQNYPNPFNPSTKIIYTLPIDAKVQIKVYDMLGREVAELVNEIKPAGYNETTFNASELSGGTYIYRITSGTYSETKKMILLR